MGVFVVEQLPTPVSDSGFLQAASAVDGILFVLAVYADVLAETTPNLRLGFRDPSTQTNANGPGATAHELRCHRRGSVPCPVDAGPIGIGERGRIVLRVAIEVQASSKPNRILADESPDLGVVVSGSVVFARV
jgi:hypothetical protein